MIKKLDHFNIRSLIAIVEKELELTSEIGNRQDCSYRPNMRQKIELKFDPLTITLREYDRSWKQENVKKPLAEIGYDISTDRIYIKNNLMDQENPFYKAIVIIANGINVESTRNVVYIAYEAKAESTRGWHDL